MKSKLSLPISSRRDLSIESTSPINSTWQSPRNKLTARLALLDPDTLARVLPVSEPDSLRSIMEEDPNIVHRRDLSGITILMHAACHSSQSPDSFSRQCEVLLEYKADINAVDADGFSVLHWAAACSGPGVIECLCSVPDIRILGKALNGDTALHRACRLGKIGNVKALIHHLAHLAVIENNELKLPHEVAGMWMGKLSTPVRDAVRIVLSPVVQKLKTLVVSHEDCLLHVPRSNGSQGDQPWESPERLNVMMRAFKRLVNDPLLEMVSDFPSATDEQVLRCHSREYLDFLYSMDQAIQGMLVPIPFTPAVQRSIARLPLERQKSSSLSDTSYSEGTLAAARRACGAVCHAVDQVLDEKCRNAFCAVRPPGHHVGYNGPLVECCGGSCGFSILNSVMVGAMHAVEIHKKRVAIVDLDVHHGNGTQNIIRQLSRPSDLMFVSIHLHDGIFYPTTGSESDFTRNVHNIPIRPMWNNQDGSTNSGRVAWINGVQKQLIPLIYSFRPDLILVSMGFDGANGDVGNCRHMVGQVSQVGLDLSTADFFAITEELCKAANGICGGRVVSVLEGGYGKVQWTELASTASDASTRAGSEDSSPTSSLRNGRKRLRSSSQYTQVINRQPLAVAATNHLKALMGLI